MNVYTLPYGNEYRTITVPNSVNRTLVSYSGAQSRAEIGRDSNSEDTQGAMARAALHTPIGTKSLHELARGKHQAVIIISDGSRLCPSHILIPVILHELREAGLTDEAVTIIVALGMHRKLTEQELRRLVGEETFANIKVINHSPQEEDCIQVGSTRYETPIAILREVVEADLRIALGNIEPHGLVGFSGGAKALLPGVASGATIEAHHALSQRFPPKPGELEHPLRLALEDALALVPLHFILNVVVNHQGRILEACAGDPILAHRAGAIEAKRRFMTATRGKFDLVVASCGGHPKDLQLYQAIKSLQNASEFCREGGQILLLAKCGEMFGNGILQHWIETIHDRERIVHQLDRQFVLGAHKVKYIDDVLSKHRVYLYSEIPQELTELVGFQKSVHLQDTLNELISEMPNSEVAIIPYASLTFPSE